VFGKSNDNILKVKYVPGIIRRYLSMANIATDNVIGRSCSSEIIGGLRR
jgi:hypothetical protein